MKATDILMEEHRVIERVIAALEQAANRLEQGQPVRPGFFLNAVDFIRGFADGCHHRKEEGVLFPAMNAQGVPQEGGPIGVMLGEHELGRQLTRALGEAAAKMEGEDESARAEVSRFAHQYATLLRQHILKEDNVLFPMAAQVIPIVQQVQLVDDFEHVEHHETGEGVHEKYLALAEELEAEIQE